jgi:hypothetical protein
MKMDKISTSSIRVTIASRYQTPIELLGPLSNFRSNNQSQGHASTLGSSTRDSFTTAVSGVRKGSQMENNGTSRVSQEEILLGVGSWTEAELGAEGKWCERERSG